MSTRTWNLEQIRSARGAWCEADEHEWSNFEAALLASNSEDVDGVPVTEDRGVTDEANWLHEDECARAAKPEAPLVVPMGYVAISSDGRPVNRCVYATINEAAKAGKNAKDSEETRGYEVVEVALPPIVPIEPSRPAFTVPEGTFRVVGTSKGVDWRTLPPGAWIRFGNDVRRMAERNHPLPAEWEAGKYELLERVPADWEPSRPLAHRTDLPAHEREISATSLEMLAAGIEEAKAGKLTPVPASALEEREPSRPGTGDGCRVCGGLCEGPCEKGRPAIAPPAPGNHPGPGLLGNGGPLLNNHEAYVAPGKPDEAPLDHDEARRLGRLGESNLARCYLAQVDIADQMSRKHIREIFDFEKERDDLRAQLATVTRDGDEVRHQRAVAEAQLATRDARIAGLEASAADLVERAQEAEASLRIANACIVAAESQGRAAVLAERARVKWWLTEWAEGTTYQSIDRVLSGAPAPTGKP